MADFEDTSAGYDEGRGYERRDRSASPRGDRDDRDERPRDRSPNGRPPAPAGDSRMKDVDDGENANTGTNLFVTGIHPRLSEQDVTQLFDKYGEVESCSIMLDPHTKESRGFGFVKMVLPEQADAAKEALQGAQIEGRTLSIEKARRGRPRSPTPGKYFGPPKRGDFGAAPTGGDRRGGSSRGGYRDRYDDRRGGGYGGRRDDYRGGPPRGYDEGYERRGYGGGRRERDDSYGGGGRIDRYESGGGSSGGGGGGRRDDYGAGRERRGGGYYGGERREERGGDRSYASGPPARDEAPPRESYSGSARGEYSGGRDDRYPAGR